METVFSTVHPPQASCRQTSDQQASYHQALSIVPAVMIVDPELSMQGTPWAGCWLKLGQRTYSIRLPESPGEVSCARCGTCFQASGPTGHADEEPICDLCLLECEEDLGLVLGLVSVMRTYGAIQFGSPDDHWEALVEAGAFARVYERRARRRTGPVRKFPVSLKRR